MSNEVLVLSHPKLTKLVQLSLDEISELSAVTIRDVQFGNVFGFLEKQLKTINPSIIITGGAHWKMLNKSDRQLNIPIFPIQISRFDFLQAALRARRYGKNIAIVLYGDEIKDIGEHLEDLDCYLQIFSYYTEVEAYAIIESLSTSGIDAIIGTSMVCTISEEFHIPSIFLHTKNSILSAFKHAAQLQSTRMEMIESIKKWAMNFTRDPFFDTLDEQEQKNFPEFSAPLLKNTFNRSSAFKDAAFDIIQNPSILFQIPTFSSDIKTSPPQEFTIPNYFYNPLYQYVSIGVFSGLSHESLEGIIHSLTQKMNHNKKSQIIFSFKENECRAFILSMDKFSGESFTQCIQSLPGSLNGFSCGISQPMLLEEVFTSMESLASTLKEALVARELVTLQPYLGPVFMIGNSSFYASLYTQAQQGALPKALLISPLLDHPNNKKLLLTLRLLLDHGLSITIVANYLGVTRQTVYKIMHKLESMLGLLSYPEKRFIISYELRIEEMRNAYLSVSEEIHNVATHYSAQ